MTRFRSLSTRILLAAYSQHKNHRPRPAIPDLNHYYHYPNSKQCFISINHNKTNKKNDAKFLFQIYISGAEGRASLFLKVKAGEVSSGFEYLFDPGRDKNDARPES